MPVRIPHLWSPGGRHCRGLRRSRTKGKGRSEDEADSVRMARFASKQNKDVVAGEGRSDYRHQRRHHNSTCSSRPSSKNQGARSRGKGEAAAAKSSLSSDMYGVLDGGGQPFFPGEGGGYEYRYALIVTNACRLAKERRLRASSDGEMHGKAKASRNQEENKTEKKDSNNDKHTDIEYFASTTTANGTLHGEEEEVPVHGPSCRCCEEIGHEASVCPWLSPESNDPNALLLMAMEPNPRTILLVRKVPLWALGEYDDECGCLKKKCDCPRFYGYRNPDGTTWRRFLYTNEQPTTLCELATLLSGSLLIGPNVLFGMGEHLFDWEEHPDHSLLSFGVPFNAYRITFQERQELLNSGKSEHCRRLTQTPVLRFFEKVVIPPVWWDPTTFFPILKTMPKPYSRLDETEEVEIKHLQASMAFQSSRLHKHFEELYAQILAFQARRTELQGALPPQSEEEILSHERAKTALKEEMASMRVSWNEYQNKSDEYRSTFPRYTELRDKMIDGPLPFFSDLREDGETPPPPPPLGGAHKVDEPHGDTPPTAATTSAGIGMTSDSVFSRIFREPEAPVHSEIPKRVPLGGRVISPRSKKSAKPSGKKAAVVTPPPPQGATPQTRTAGAKAKKERPEAKAPAVVPFPIPSELAAATSGEEPNSAHQQSAPIRHWYPSTDEEAEQEPTASACTGSAVSPPLSPLEMRESILQEAEAEEEPEQHPSDDKDEEEDDNDEDSKQPAIAKVEKHTKATSSRETAAATRVTATSRHGHSTQKTPQKPKGTRPTKQQRGHLSASRNRGRPGTTGAGATSRSNGVDSDDDFLDQLLAAVHSTRTTSTTEEVPTATTAAQAPQSRNTSTAIGTGGNGGAKPLAIFFPPKVLTEALNEVQSAVNTSTPTDAATGSAIRSCLRALLGAGAIVDKKEDPLAMGSKGSSSVLVMPRAMVQSYLLLAIALLTLKAGEGLISNEWVKYKIGSLACVLIEALAPQVSDMMSAIFSTDGPQHLLFFAPVLKLLFGELSIRCEECFNVQERLLTTPLAQEVVESLRLFASQIDADWNTVIAQSTAWPNTKVVQLLEEVAIHYATLVERGAGGQPQDHHSRTLTAISPFAALELPLFLTFLGFFTPTSTPSQQQHPEAEDDAAMGDYPWGESHIWFRFLWDYLSGQPPSQPSDHSGMGLPELRVPQSWSAANRLRNLYDEEVKSITPFTPSCLLAPMDSLVALFALFGNQLAPPVEVSERTQKGRDFRSLFADAVPRRRDRGGSGTRLPFRTIDQTKQYKAAMGAYGALLSAVAPHLFCVVSSIAAGHCPSAQPTDSPPTPQPQQPIENSFTTGSPPAGGTRSSTARDDSSPIQQGTSAGFDGTALHRGGGDDRGGAAVHQQWDFSAVMQLTWISFTEQYLRVRPVL